jgi:ribonucleoside-diphosphate reductase alpha chain
MHGARERLPNRRPAETWDIEVGGLRYTTTIGFYPNGRIGEIFLTNHKAGSAAGMMASDSAVLCSIALQHGVPIETLRHALMRDGRGKPSGPLGVVLDQLSQQED